MFTLVVFVPRDGADDLLEAIFAAGAGKVGNYDRCAFVSHGEGRFRPLTGAVPSIGIVGSDERVEETRIECIVLDERVDAVIAALLKAHPYEEPAFYLYSLDDRCLGLNPKS